MASFFLPNNRATTTVAAVSTALAAGLLLAGCTNAAPDAAPTATAPASSASATAFNGNDVMFAQMMLPHHEQALEMSAIVLETPGVDARVTELAQQIAAAQGPEIDQLTQWLSDWGVDAGAGDHSGHGMAGMLTEDDLAQLRDADGPATSILFLEQMIEHHVGAVDMAEPLLSNGENAEVRALAQNVVSSQNDEIDTMRTLLAELQG
ncbi:DUF305 domain-containing protein [Lysinibacter cavernae]|uniref:Uncharacterized protein (DUF305 family) n=1 Tax=Lysinibacter cavernae TaxID=1640652 RepID=A0A7X5QZX1_9MICO|nr:DUF305 domain-containing protein [Lysinibacter cavernae]NIH53059.1 uncharacterized protein (DUF305 family) [Lysinibacter cavernae]